MDEINNYLQMFTFQKQVTKHSHRVLLRSVQKMPFAATLQPQRRSDFDDLDPEARERQTQMIMDRIANQKREIGAKTKEGRKLVSDLAANVHVDKFEREQRYEIFINKMFQLYKYEKRALKKQREGFLRMTTAPLMSDTPVKLILTEYSKLSSQGFDGRLYSQTIEHLLQTIQGRGNKPRVFGDYTLPEMDTSWRMSKLAEDLKYALSSDQFFSSPLMAKTARLLGELGYKNTELLPLWFSKIERMIKVDKRPAKIGGTDVGSLFNDAVYGSYFNLKPRHYVYKGQFQHEEFQSHLRTLKEWHDSPKPQMSADAEAQELQDAMGNLIEQVREIKGLQEEQQAAIAALREQYFRLKKAQDKHAFLQQNKYLRYDMLELQELLVKGGFLEPEEALRPPEGGQAEKMARAVDVFYDLVLNQHDEFISPQYDQLAEATVPQQTKTSITEVHNRMNALTFSQTLVGIADQVQSFRRDVHGWDYPNKFYEDLLMPPEYLRKSDRLHEDFKKFVTKQTPTNVLMERSYLKPWLDFFSHTSNAVSTIRSLLQSHSSNLNWPRFLESNIASLRALSACKFAANSLRQEIYDNVKAHAAGIAKVKESQILIDGLVGIATGPDRGDAANEMAQSLLKAFDQRRIDALSFKERVEVLNAVCVADLMDTQATKSEAMRVAKQIVNSIDDLWFDNTDNELTIQDFELLHEAFLTMQLSMDQNVRALNFKNQNLLSSLETPELHRMRYPESQAAQYDPLKPRIVSGLAAGLSKANLEVLHTWQESQTDLASFDGLNKFPYKPDILCGQQGTKIGVYLINERETMRDSGEADGRVQHRLKLVERAHRKNKRDQQIVPVTIPVKAVVDYDLVNFKLALRDDFDISAFISKAQTKSKRQAHDISISNLATLAANLTREQPESGNFDRLLGQFFSLFEAKQRSEGVYEPEQLDAAYDELKYHLMKLSLIYEALLTPLELEQLTRCLPANQTFPKLISNMKREIEKAQKANKQHPAFRKQALSDQFESNWLGQRQSVELPKQANSGQKAIEPEILNRNFLYVQDYHHYRDWQEEIEKTYDQFNMLQLPLDKADTIKIFRDPARHNRKVPHGIFPHPLQKRTVLEHSSSEPARIESGYSDRFAEFEKDPMAFMRKSELRKAKEMRPITPDVSMMVNLSNVKQGLKAEMPDAILADFVFNKLNLTGQLIQDHLNQLDGKNWQINDQISFVPRDPSAFREFCEQKQDSVPPYTQFYLREAVKQGFPEGLYEEYKAAARDPRQKAKAAKLLEQLENALVNYRRGNEDFFNLSKALDNYLEVSVDVEALGVLPDRTREDPIENALSDEQYLQRKRVQAETALIKTTIIYKRHNDIPLSSLEQRYAKLWSECSKQPRALVTNDLMVPDHPSMLKISDLTPEDLYALNSLPGVEFTRSTHGEYAANDLVLELAHLVERDTVRKVELKMLEATLKDRFGIQSSFSLVQQRNKEIDLLHQEVEEVQWRKAAQLDDREKTAIKQILGLGRGIDKFDKVFWDLDQKSFDAFFAEANTFDNRSTLLENWICRKEEEFKSRVSLPTKALNKSDQALHRDFDAPRQRARETLVGQMLTSDEFGVERQKSYAHLTSKELHLLTESLVVRLNLFSQKYPAFLPQVVQAIMHHPNLTLSDRATLDSYCTLFELDWRGDRVLANREEFLMTNPVYMNARDGSNMGHLDAYDESYVRERLHQASVPFLDELAAKIAQ